MIGVRVIIFFSRETEVYFAWAEQNSDQNLGGQIVKILHTLLMLLVLFSFNKQLLKEVKFEYIFGLTLNRWAYSNCSWYCLPSQILLLKIEIKHMSTCYDIYFEMLWMAWGKLLATIWIYSSVQCKSKKNIQISLVGILSETQF